MGPFEAVVLGAVEGLTEFLPVSSTGHLILTSHLLDLEHTPFLASFEISIQLGAILAVVLLFRERFTRDLEVWKRIALAFIPTGIVGFSVYPLVKGVLLGNDLVVVVALIAVGILLIVAERVLQGRVQYHDINEVPLRHVFLAGVFQACAIVPGVSRSGATILGGLFLGLSRRGAAEFAFLLAVPTMLAATGYDLLRSGASFTRNEWLLTALGFLVAFGVASLSVRWMLAFVSRHSFMPFAVYRILLGGVYALVFLV